jgi:multicomponent Na+:H+ antiporter subunit G
MMIIREFLSITLIIIGAAFMLVAAIGVLRMPDLYLRMSASTKAATLGISATFLGLAIHFNELGVSSRAIAVIIFILLTAPVAAHMMGRAAYFNGVPLWEGTHHDDLRGRYDEKTHQLSSDDEEADLTV